METDIETGLRIKNIREETGLSQREFACKIGITVQSHMSKIELGTSQPTNSCLRKITSNFGYSADYILNGCEFQNKPEELSNALLQGIVFHANKIVSNSLLLDHQITNDIVADEQTDIYESYMRRSPLPPFQPLPPAP